MQHKESEISGRMISHGEVLRQRSLGDKYMWLGREEKEGDICGEKQSEKQCISMKSVGDWWLREWHGARA